MIDEKPVRIHYHLPILVDVERLNGLYVAYLPERPDVIGCGDHLMEALRKLADEVLDELERE